jgi:hypothetical protein
VSDGGDGNGNGNGGGNGKRPYVGGKYIDGKYVPVPPSEARWKPGQSGNPKGRVAGRPSSRWFNQPKEVRDLAREHTAEAIATLVHVMRRAKDMRVRCAAAMALLDRGWGRPIETIQRTDFRMAPIAIVDHGEVPDTGAAGDDPSPTEKKQ